MKMKAVDADGNKLPWYTVDARRSIAEIHAEIKAIADQTLLDVSGNDIAKLWS